MSRAYFVSFSNQNDITVLYCGVLEPTLYPFTTEIPPVTSNLTVLPSNIGRFNQSRPENRDAVRFEDGADATFERGDQ